MVKFWDDSLAKVVTRFLDAPVCNIATGETLFTALSQVLGARNIPWSNVIGFASDSASVMVGKRNSVLSRVIQQQPSVFSMGCVCHLSALCAAAGLKKLPLSVDDLLIDIFYHFKHSSKRCAEFFMVLKDFDGIAPVRVLKHCSTRWLSLERALNRLLLLWPALFAYFDREAERSSDKLRSRRVLLNLGKVDTKLYCHFVAFALKPLNTFNTAFQTSASKIGTLQEDVRSLLRAFLSNPNSLQQLPMMKFTALIMKMMQTTCPVMNLGSVLPLDSSSSRVKMSLREPMQNRTSSVQSILNACEKLFPNFPFLTLPSVTSASLIHSTICKYLWDL